MVEIGSQAWPKFHRFSFTKLHFPTVDYKVDGASGESPQVAPLDKALTQPRAIVISQPPWLDPNESVVYFRTPKLADGTHRIDIAVATANESVALFLDYFLISPPASGSSSRVETSPNIPPSTSTSPIPPTTTTPSPPTATTGATLAGAIGWCGWWHRRSRHPGYCPGTSGECVPVMKSLAQQKFSPAKVCTHSIDYIAENVRGLLHRYHPGSSVRWLQWARSPACTLRR
jgi:hypothetical protein